MGEIDSRLEELVREVEGARGSTSPPPRQVSAAAAAATAGAPPSREGSPDRFTSRPGRPAGSGGARWLPAFLVLLLCNLLSGGLGYWMGLRQALQAGTPSPVTPAEQLLRQGWKHDGSGVFYRWCSEDCHAPRLYGGGLIREFQVRCLERPCGDLSMQFQVLNARGETLETLKPEYKDVRQGEERRIYVESENPQAASFQLIAFVARARM
jgi:hypothetical protein